MLEGSVRKCWTFSSASTVLRSSVQSLNLELSQHEEDCVFVRFSLFAVTWFNITTDIRTTMLHLEGGQ